MVHNTDGESCVVPGTAVVHAHISDGNNVHFSVEVMDGAGNVTHTHLMPNVGHTETPISNYGGSSGAPQITFDLPNGAAARDFQMSKVGTEQGPYDFVKNSCLTHVCDVLRAGGVDDIPTNGRLLLIWANHDGMTSMYCADG
ncbi:hypothetical protein [Streptomyces hyaluromycini]|uniref:hypothetical protein n=1 Tax=Streptomyces hyaluromycini TaxID=1377993 RepID=UPI0011AE57DE|nr:hypothetical protein [Streptomyces hyaluromycini]